MLIQNIIVNTNIIHTSRLQYCIPMQLVIVLDSVLCTQVSWIMMTGYNEISLCQCNKVKWHENPLLPNEN